MKPREIKSRQRALREEDEHIREDKLKIKLEINEVYGRNCRDTNACGQVKIATGLRSEALGRSPNKREDRESRLRLSYPGTVLGELSRGLDISIKNSEETRLIGRHGCKKGKARGGERRTAYLERRANAKNNPHGKTAVTIPPPPPTFLDNIVPVEAHMRGDVLVQKEFLAKLRALCTVPGFTDKFSHL